MIKRPALRYHGGKFRLAPRLMEFFPNHRCYVEPFGGGASVLLRKAPSYAEVYNDLDGEVVNFFKVLRDHPEELRRLCELTPFSRVDFVEAFENIDDPVEQARRTVVRSFFGFGSASVTAHKHSSRIGKPSTGFRANSNRSGTTPAHDWMNFPEQIPLFAERLRWVVIEQKSAFEVMPQHDGLETLFYVDPPYMPETRDRGADYAHELTIEEHAALAEMLISLNGMVVLSGYASESYDRWFKDWQRFEIDAFADGALPRVEVVWINAQCAQRLARDRVQLSIFDQASGDAMRGLS